MFGNNPGTDETWKLIPQGSVGIELGVWKGDSTDKFLRRAKFVHAVDAWSPEPYKTTDEFGDYQRYLDRYSVLTGRSTPEEFKKFYDQIFNGVVNRFKNKPVMIWRMDTNEFFKEWRSKENLTDSVTHGWQDGYPKVDWIYVDASHAYDQVLLDLHNSVDIVKPGGIIFGDDYSDKKPGVRNAVDKFVQLTGFNFVNFHDDQYYIEVNHASK